MFRYELINELIKRNGYKSYLEIGTQGDNCLKHVYCEFKVGVDPDPILHENSNSNEFYKLTSDDFFKQNKRRFDIIFIDGLHDSIQVYKDIENSLKILNGVIVIHDCNPLSEQAQRSVSYENGKIIIPHVPTWNGDVWKAWVYLYKTRPDLQMMVIDIDQGCGLIKKRYEIFDKIKSFEYSDLENNRRDILNLNDKEGILYY